ncbi:MAG: T9SS type A sorting domain-containing protein [Bacteroidetes bacterium]|nr:T9SS type A sorting domain-containing protein [Bacteroidota bacterium]
MKRILFITILICLTLPSYNFIFAQQYCIPGRFDTTYCFSSQQITVEDNISYGQNINWQGNPVNLDFIIAYPGTEADTLRKRPFILLIHGGGFIDGNKYQVAPVMMDFAQRGYVCASINYRIGWDVTGDPFACLGTGTSLAKAVYRAMQDSKAALRYFSANANKYRIDTNYFFCGGISAGAVTSLLISFATQENMNTLYPSFINELGPLNNASNNLTNSYKIKCVLSSSGGLNDTTFINSSNAVPTIMFQGTADLNIPYGTGNVYGCANYLRTMGSAEMMKRFKNLRKPFELDYVPGGGHENFYPIEYIPKKAAGFLKRYLCNDSRQVIFENYSMISDVSLGGFNDVIPSDFTLYQNYPNPFNPSTTIKYFLPHDSRIKINIYDTRGRKIMELADGFQSEGFHTVNFAGAPLSSGIYFYSMITETNGTRNIFTKKMVLVK